MSVTGKVQNRVVILPTGTKLPEGTSVRIEPLEMRLHDDPFVADVERLAKPRPQLPKDYALNHGHYVRSEPKR